ncbi:bifunctional proline dehydrogenase/L-glutamate gamma-semialdehyde dehydrogenase PutA [Salinibius halmophilus]|uniref:bifunctional proline dehydrogenase/L-glutamate gamma-semialdehyde dehydrogenase PutA n=1 Tax=Salinibius halmophilus TaxID=1853216 RepID=UPI000E660CCE|nr:bifunctional proline dehydrogenase/L-glutamate gamma-semialdehyde dehydrogenase PutA [Salinibius halmophilus]
MALTFSSEQLFSGQYAHLTPEQWLSMLSQHYMADEELVVADLLSSRYPSNLEATIADSATQLVTSIRQRHDGAHAVDKLLQQYSLGTEEGVILMCLAEALMRVPDAHTADALIRDKLSEAHWDAHLGQSDSLLVNASTWGLLLTGKVTGLASKEQSAGRLLSKLINKTGEPVIRAALAQAMKIMGKQFVLGRSIDEAIKNGKSYRERGYTYSFDMLGEAALTDKDAEFYFQQYLTAITTLAAKLDAWAPGLAPPSVSIKLSALHPRYEVSQSEQMLPELAERVLALVSAAREHGISITIDAEEADRLELSLELFRTVYQQCQGWGGFGMVVQAYSKRALAALGYLQALAKAQGDAIPVRLVKGAYWDSEIKHAQLLGLEDYPVFTRKDNTDLSYLVCAQYLLGNATELLPQFASHNAHTVCAIRALAEHYQTDRFEFQRLHGMGDRLYDEVMSQYQHNVRIYAPVGAHKDLLPYLVRRLLENGANSSFVHRLEDANTPVSELVASPIARVAERQTYRNPNIVTARSLFHDRRNSRGVNLSIADQRLAFMQDLTAWQSHVWQAYPLIDGQPLDHELQAVLAPYNLNKQVGQVAFATPDDAQHALTVADQYWWTWQTVPVADKANAIRRLADLMEANFAELIALCVHEAGKTLQDSIDEIREAVDFCRYYANEAEKHFSTPTLLPGPTGESNEHYYQGRGVFVCISPWNFPLAIFTGQMVAALLAGNCVLVKPAEQTSLIAYRAVEMAIAAGIPASALHFLPGDGAQLGGSLLTDARVTGVAFTGSNPTANLISRQLSERGGAMATFIAETGGQNAMIVDSTALPEQVVKDAMQSAFASAGQRCSALRVMCVQEEIADRVIELIEGALDRWQVGDPNLFATDCGPVIDQDAHNNLQAYLDQQTIIKQAKLTTQAGHFIAPSLIEIDSIAELGAEQFGPILHIYRFKASELDQLIADINATGYGLTLGIHSRNERTAAYIEARVRVGNCYINRNQIGAVVGVQPFGGRGLSGTGPKAGGPNYLLRFATERVRTVNTAAVGGNASLLAMDS